MAAGRSVAIVDNDEVARQSVASLLSPTGLYVKLFESGDQFLSTPDSAGFSCVLLALQIPGHEGFVVLRARADRGESPPALLVAARGGIAAAVDAMKFGAVDFLEKPYVPGDLLAAVRKALTGDLEGEDARARREAAAARLEGLSQRQMQVLRGILSGHSSRIIAYGLGISTRTVEAYRGQLLERLGVRSIAEAVRLAIAAGMA